MNTGEIISGAVYIYIIFVYSINISDKPQTCLDKGYSVKQQKMQVNRIV